MKDRKGPIEAGENMGAEYREGAVDTVGLALKDAEATLDVVMVAVASELREKAQAELRAYVLLTVHDSDKEATCRAGEPAMASAYARLTAALHASVAYRGRLRADGCGPLALSVASIRGNIKALVGVPIVVLESHLAVLHAAGGCLTDAAGLIVDSGLDPLADGPQNSKEWAEAAARVESAVSAMVTWWSGRDITSGSLPDVVEHLDALALAIAEILPSENGVRG